MSLEKKISIDKIEIDENSTIHVREITRILEDGKEISSSFHRWTLLPGDNIKNQDKRVIAVAKSLWKIKDE